MSNLHAKVDQEVGLRYSKGHYIGHYIGTPCSAKVERSSEEKDFEQAARWSGLRREVN